jgi:pyruvate formate lyase activating enzyme
MPSLAEILQKYTIEGELYEKLEDGRVRCLACGHRCSIQNNASGICKVRFNRGGILQVPFGYVSGMQCDPIEKKPFFHVLPGGLAFSFGMLGCNFHCSYCQNWITSQTLRDPDAVSLPSRISQQDVVEMASNHGAGMIISTYNEPLITIEWSVAIFKEAKAAGQMTGYVSNGYGSREALEYLRPWIDLYKVDLKCFNDRQYRRLGGRLQPVLDTIRALYQMGVWMEIVTLLVPGFNDSQEELAELTKFICSVSPDIPWHVTAFHRNYRMTDPDDTAPEDLMRAVQIGQSSGLHYIYAGNLPGMVKNLENTCCANCGELLVSRRGYRILSNRLKGDGRCPSCRQIIPGRWVDRSQRAAVD